MLLNNFPIDGRELPGHVFISYVREDRHRVDELQRVLEAAGINVWRDTANLWPGEDWRLNIRSAITDNALVFIACFSQASLARRKSYQNEELTLAIEQLRLRHPNEPWLIPVRFDECKIPDRDIGSGRTLTSIQRVDLFGNLADEKAQRLVSAVLRILGRHSAQEGSTAVGICAADRTLSRSQPREQSRRRWTLPTGFTGLIFLSIIITVPFVLWPHSPAGDKLNSYSMYLPMGYSVPLTAAKPTVSQLSLNNDGNIRASIFARAILPISASLIVGVKHNEGSLSYKYCSTNVVIATYVAIVSGTQFCVIEGNYIAGVQIIWFHSADPSFVQLRITIWQAGPGVRRQADP